MKFYTLDIETKARPKEELPNDVYERLGKDCALHPQYNEITCIGVHDGETGKVYRDLYEIKHMAEDPSVFFNGHNLGWDLYNLRHHGVDIPESRWLYDSQLIWHILPVEIPDTWIKKYNEKRDRLNKELPKGCSHRVGTKLSLKTLAPYFLGVNPFWEDPSDHDNDDYVLKDCLYSHNLTLVGLRMIQDMGKDAFLCKQMEYSRMLYRMKCRGIGLNKEVFLAKEKEYQQKREEQKQILDNLWGEHHQVYLQEKKQLILADSDRRCNDYIQNRLKKKDKAAGVIERYKKSAEEKIKKLPEGINYDSDDQMLWLLKERLGYDVTTFEGDESTGVEVLEKLAGEGHDDIKAFLKYREATKIVTSYFPTYRCLMINWRLHPNFNITGTRTGRLSSSNPNLQQVPSELYCIFAPSEGKSFIDYDEAAIEAKLITYYSEDSALMEIEKSGGSIHDYRTKFVFFEDDEDVKGIEVSEVKAKAKRQRDATKNCGFANFYGAGAKRIAITMTKAGFPTSEEKAIKLWQKDKSFFQGVTEFHLAITEAFKRGDTIDNLMGRPIHIHKRSDAYMKGFNTLIQSSASDLVLDACYNAYCEFVERGISAHPVALIHDAILVEADDRDLSTAESILIDKMTQYNLESSIGKITLQVEGKSGKVWQK